MAANIISVANVAGKNNIVYPSVATVGFPCDGIILQVIPSVTIGSTACVTQITVVKTGDVYYTSTTVATIYTAGAYTGSSKFSFTSTIAAKDGNAFASTAVMGFPSKSVLLESITSTTYGSTACVTKITHLDTNATYYTADTVSALITLTT